MPDLNQATEEERREATEIWYNHPERLYRDILAEIMERNYKFD